MCAFAHIKNIIILHCGFSDSVALMAFSFFATNLALLSEGRHYLRIIHILPYYNVLSIQKWVKEKLDTLMDDRPMPPADNMTSKGVLSELAMELHAWNKKRWEGSFKVCLRDNHGL